MAAYSSGSEALDAAEVEDLLVRLFLLGDAPHTGMPRAVRARAWAQIAEVSGQIAEVSGALARLLAAGGAGEGGAVA
jgi:hypothetical protein